MRARLRIKTTQIPPLFPVFQYSNPSFPYLTYTLHILTYPSILCILFTLSTCRVAEKNQQESGASLYFFFFLIFFFIFVCIKGYPSLAPKKEKFHDGERRNKNCVKKLCASRLHIKNLQSTSSLKDILRRRIEQKLVQ